MNSIVELSGVSKRYGDFQALRDVSFTIEPGSIVGLIGPNGAGKTTTLKSILGLTAFDGDMSVVGVDPRRGRHEVMQRVCFVADVGAALLPRFVDDRCLRSSTLVSLTIRVSYATNGQQVHPGTTKQTQTCTNNNGDCRPVRDW